VNVFLVPVRQNGEQPEVENRKQTKDVGQEPSVVSLHDPSAIKKSEFLYAKDQPSVLPLACLVHHFLPELSIALKNGWLVSGTSQRMSRDSISGIGSTNRKWNLGMTSGFLPLRKE
jgi:hypothetical protein